MALTINDTEGERRPAPPRVMARLGLHRVHWAVIGLSLVLTLTAAFFTRTEIDAKLDARFEQQSEQAVSLVIERMEKYEGSLWGGVAAIQAAGGDMRHQEWVEFSGALEIDERYPGINGIGVIHHVRPEDLDDYLADQRADRPDYDIHPQHDKTVFLPITYIEPADINAAAVGLDMAHEANRFDGVMRSRDTGTAQITGPIVLVQDANQTPGFLFFAPWYEGRPNWTSERTGSFSGVVYAPFVFSELMNGALDETQRQVGLRISDGEDILFDEHTAMTDGFDPDPLLQQAITVPIYGREWVFDIWTDQAFRDSAANNEPLVILLGGLLIDALLIALFASTTRSQHKAHELAVELTSELREKTERLETSNAELERFAYVASHDLKTPLRGIADLTEYLEEDLTDYLASPDANPDVALNLNRLESQASRMDDLIKGILDYSRLGAGDITEMHPFSLEGAISKIANDIGLRPDQVDLHGGSSCILPAGIYLEQVLQSLLVNAAAHHHASPEHLHIIVTVTQGTNRLIIEVSDNGPGIEPRHHQRIFEMFQQLDPTKSGTGIGLSVVKRMIENHGGTIDVSSRLGEGTTFAFTWPGTFQPAAPALELTTTEPLVAEGAP